VAADEPPPIRRDAELLVAETLGEHDAALDGKVSDIAFRSKVESVVVTDGRKPPQAPAREPLK
jgi:hypothetical protein